MDAAASCMFLCSSMLVSSDKTMVAAWWGKDMAFQRYGYLSEDAKQRANTRRLNEGTAF